MRRIIGFGMAFTLVTVLTVAASAQDLSIMLGQGIGDLQIGQDLESVLTALGPLHSQDDLPGGAYRGYYWPLKRIGVIADKESKKIVALAVSYDEEYRTEKGIAAGADMDTIRVAYGQEEDVESHQEDDTLIYDKLGVAFVVDKSGALGGRISVIFVFGQGRYHDIFTEQ